jgi:hypothetical protein
MKNQILLENYYLPGQFKQRLAEIVDYCNLRRYHESLDNLTLADVCFGRVVLKPSDTEGKHQAENHRATTPAASSVCGHNFNSDGLASLLNLLLTYPKGSDDIQDLNL